MEQLIIYEKPTCTTCRKVSRILSEKGIDFEKVNYYIEPFTKSKLKELLKKMNMKPGELLRKNESAYKDLDIKNKKYSEEEILNLMIKNPDLVQRPILEMGNKAVLGRPPEKIYELF
jgi:arsenate reductase